MTDAAKNIDFGQIFGDICNGKFNSYPSYPSSSMSEEEAIDDTDYEKLYNELKQDFSSYKKRIENQKDTDRKILLKELILGFLDIIDYYMWIYASKRILGEMTKEDKMMMERLFKFLERYDVKPMQNCEGKPLDVSQHDAMMVDSSGNGESGTISKVLSMGYMIGDEVLRHARVSVFG